MTNWISISKEGLPPDDLDVLFLCIDSNSLRTDIFTGFALPRNEREESASIHLTNGEDYNWIMEDAKGRFYFHHARWDDLVQIVAWTLQPRELLPEEIKRVI